MKLTLALSAAFVLCLAGCATFNKEVAPRVAKAVNHYCLEPQEARVLVRAQVNEMVKPHEVRVACAGDQP